LGPKDYRHRDRGFPILNLTIQAQDAGGPVIKLIKKGVLTDHEGEEVRADMMRDFSQTAIVAESSTTGIATLIDNTAQIGMSSRRAKPTEMSAASAKGITFRPTIVAFDAMSIIVNQANGLTGLTKKNRSIKFSLRTLPAGGRRRKTGQNFCLRSPNYLWHLFPLKRTGDEKARLRG